MVSEKTEIDPGAALCVLLDDLLSAMGMSQETRMSLLLALHPAVDTFSNKMQSIVSSQGREPLPIAVLELVDSRVAILRMRGVGSPVAVDLESGAEIKLPALSNPPVLSVAISLTAIWMKTVARLLGLDSAAEAFESGLSGRQTAV